jgi:hypothetical protein
VVRVVAAILDDEKVHITIYDCFLRILNPLMDLLVVDLLFLEDKKIYFQIKSHLRYNLTNDNDWEISNGYIYNDTCAS